MNHAYCVGLNPAWKKMRFQLVLNKTFCPNPQPLTHRRLKQRQKTKINKTMLSAPLSSLPPSPLIGCPYKVHNIRIEKAKKYSILTVNELEPPVLDFSARISKFYAPTDSEYKFNKTELGTRNNDRYTIFIR